MNEVEVRRLFSAAAAHLATDGRFVAGFRNYETLPAGDERFILVRADDRRVHTCFLETLSASQLRVHDLLHERNPDGHWRVTLGSYPKLRLAPARAVALAGEAGLDATVAPAPRGFCQLIARRAA